MNHPQGKFTPEHASGTNILLETPVDATANRNREIRALQSLREVFEAQGEQVARLRRVLDMLTIEGNHSRENVHFLELLHQEMVMNEKNAENAGPNDDNALSGSLNQRLNSDERILILKDIKSRNAFNSLKEEMRKVVADTQRVSDEYVFELLAQIVPDLSVEEMQERARIATLEAENEAIREEIRNQATD